MIPNMEINLKENKASTVGGHHALCPRILKISYIDCRVSGFCKSVKLTDSVCMRNSQHVTCRQTLRR